MNKTVTVSRGATINLGDRTFESSRIDLTVQIECGQEDMTYSLETLDEWLVDQITKRIQAIQKEAGLLDTSASRFTGRRD